MSTRLSICALALVLGMGLAACGDDDGGTDSVCGDDTTTGLETCDGPDLRDNDCTTIGLGYTGGELACNDFCDGWDIAGCTTGACGDDEVNTGELCDGADLDGQDCASIGMGFTDGTLACAGTCGDWDVTGCTTEPTCGNDSIQTGELCDGADLDGQDCASIGMGFTWGTLACAASCADWDTSGCMSGPGCGNNVIEGDEKCDGVALNGYACSDVSYSLSGTLACNANCTGWDTSGCTLATCGDGVISGNEWCDGADLGGETCASLGPFFSGGTLGCGDGCRYWDVSLCISAQPVCGNGVKEGFEPCDGADVGGAVCADLGFDSGSLACDNHCQLDLSGCVHNAAPGWICDLQFYDETAGGGSVYCDCGCGIMDPDCNDATFASCEYCNVPFSCNGPDQCSASSIIDSVNNAICTAPTCGNALAEGTEMCDGADLRGAQCQDLNQAFTGGTLACAAGCTFDTSNCTLAVCGNNMRDGIEWCDGADLGGDSCQALGFTGGTLACDANCQFDTINCTFSTCGDGTTEGAEICDGADLNGWVCDQLPWGYIGGTLACYGNCSLDTSQCTPSVCGDNVASNDEECDGTDMGVFTSQLDCTFYGWDSGTVGCTGGCGVDFGACVSATIPSGWTCFGAFYDDGLCDCGCGVVDLDCADSTVASCQACGEVGSCSVPGIGCPSNIDPTNNSQCL